MATREKKSKLNSNSPTPASESSSAPSTPTGKKTPLLLSATKPAKRRGRPSLAASGTSLDQENDDEQSTSEEPAKSKSGRIYRTTNKSIVIDVKEEIISDSGIEVKKDVDDEFNTEIKKTNAIQTRGKGIRRGGLKRGIGTRATNIVKEGLIKRRAVPFLIKRGRGGRRRIATSRADAIKELVKDEKLVKSVMANKRGVGRPKKIVEQAKEKVQRKRRRLLTDLKDVEKNPVKLMKVEHLDEIVSDSELTKLRRGRSESISKSSDTTDTLSMIETSFKKEDSEIKEIENNNADQQEIDMKNIKEEMIDESDSSSQQKSDSKLLRRSGRPKKIKEREGSVTPKSKMKLESSTDEPLTIEEVLEDGKCTPLTIDTSASKTTISPAASRSGSVTETEKASSLSPELISEGVNVISVKKFYGEPQFLENNLGIEKDPKLGEIVVHEKNKNVDEKVDEKVVETKIVESKVVDTKVVELKVADKIVEPKVVDAIVEEVVESKVVDTKVVESKVADKIVDIKVDDAKIVDTKEVDTKVVETKVTETIVDHPKIIEIAAVDEKVDEKLVVEVCEDDKKRDGKIVQKILSDDKILPEINKTETEEIKLKSTIVDESKEQIIEEKLITEVEDLDNTMDSKNDSVKSEMGPLVYSESSDEAENGAKEEMDEKTGESSDNSTDKDSKNGSEHMEIDESLINETPESIKEKESHLKLLGLLTHEAKATIEKAKRSKSSSKTTGTLKTVIKLHRAEKRKRLPLKMTFQKGRAKTSASADKDSVANSGGEDTYYTIQNDVSLYLFLNIFIF